MLYLDFMVSTATAAAIVGIDEQVLRNEIHRNKELALRGEQGRAREWSEADVVHLAVYKALKRTAPVAVMAARTAAEIARHFAKHKAQRYAVVGGYNWRAVADGATAAELEVALGGPDEIQLINLSLIRRLYREAEAAE